MAESSFVTGEHGVAARWWVRHGVGIAGALFLAAAVAAIWNFVAADRDRDDIALQNRIELTLERVMSTARDMETGSRGFALVGNDRYLQPFRASIDGLADAETEVRKTWALSGRPARDIESVFGILERKRANAMQLVDARRSGGLENARAFVETGEGRTIMDELRQQVGRLQSEAHISRRLTEDAERHRSLWLTVVSILFALAACALLGFLALYRRQMARAATAELAGLGDRFRALADNIPQLAWMADPEGRLYWYNQRWYDYTGQTAADMEQHGWKKVHDPDYLEGASARFFEAIRSGETWRDVFPLRGRDGEYRWFLSMAQPIRNAKGEIVRWFGTNTDITEQRRQEEELAAARDAAEEANRAKSQFLANMSHELRTPLSAVIGYSEMLEEEVEEMGEKHLLDDLMKIKSNARHLLSLINDVLDISKIEANKMEVFAETFDVAAMVRDVAGTVGSLVEKKDNRLVVEAGRDLGAMHTDVVKVRQILINLLSNAAKFTEKGEIRLVATRAHGEGDAIVFEVRDTGMGMTQEQVERLFERFNQADASTTRRFGGTGLGLAITRAFTDMLGGHVSVSSRPGEGSSFVVTIPAEMPQPHDGADANEAGASPAEAGDTILVIDDDAATRDLLTRFLTREGYTVRVAFDGPSGLALAETLKPQVILLDVTMPRMDGWTVLRSLKSDPYLAEIPVIMCTIIDEKTLGFSLGASDYVLKPVDWDRLREVLARIQGSDAGGHVLVVDDDADARHRLNGLLRKNGWTVSEAGNGREALEAVEKALPSLVLLDLNMPEMDGFTFLRRFRSAPDWASVPVVVMTARDLSAAERTELKGGGAQIFAKGDLGMQELAAQLRAIRPQRATAPRADATAGTAP